MTSEAKEFFNEILVTEGDIFKECTIELPQYKQVLIKLIHVVVHLEQNTSLSISTGNLAEAAPVMVYVGGASTRLDWIHRTIKKIHEQKELQHQYHKVLGLKVRVNESEQLLLQ